MKNFATRVGEFFTRKKKDVAKEAEETENEIEEAVDQAVDKTAKAKEEVKQELGMLYMLYSPVFNYHRFWYYFLIL